MSALRKETFLDDPGILQYTKSPPVVSSNVFASPLPLVYTESQIHELINEYCTRRDEIHLIQQKGRRVPAQLESEMQNLDLKVHRFILRLGVPLFQKVSDRQILETVRRMRMKRCREGDVIYEMGSNINYAIIIITSHFQAQADVHGRLYPVAELLPGNTVGDKFLIGNNTTSEFKLVCTKAGVYGVLTRELVAGYIFASPQRQIDSHSIMNTLKTQPCFQVAYPTIFKESCMAARVLTLANGQKVTVDLAGGEVSDDIFPVSSVVYVAKGMIEILGRIKISADRKTSLIPLFSIGPGEFFGHVEVMFGRGIFWRKLKEFIRTEMKIDIEISGLCAKAVSDYRDTGDRSQRDIVVALWTPDQFDSLVNYPRKEVAKRMIPKLDDFLVKYAERLQSLVQGLTDRKKIVKIDNEGNLVSES